MMSTLRDLWIYPVDIDEANQTIVILEGVTNREVVVPVGTYWPYKDGDAPAAFADDYPSLYEAIETAINATADGSWSTDVATPLDSSEFTNGGLEFNNTSGAFALGFNTTHASWTFPEFLLGITDDGTYNETSADPWTSDHSRGGLWQSPRCSVGSLGGSAHVQFGNRGGRSTRQMRRWRTDFRRLMSYHWVPAGHIKHRANEDASYAGSAGLATGDHGNYLHDLHTYGLSTQRDVILVHKVAQADIGLGIFAAGEGWEIVSILNDKDAEDLDNIIELQERTGAHFGVDIPVWSASYASILDAYGADVAATYYRRHV